MKSLSISCCSKLVAPSRRYKPSPSRELKLRNNLRHAQSFLLGTSLALLPGVALAESGVQTRTTMLFGGFFKKKPIDYTSLSYPANEMGEAAKAGEVPSVSKQGYSIATFAGGCFWGLELAYQRVPGVTATAVGYTQGDTEEPTYQETCSGTTGHTEAVQVYYDPKECSFDTLLDVFVKRVDMSQVNGQGNDRGTQYRTGVYFHTPEQEAQAKQRFQEVQEEYSRAGPQGLARMVKEVASELKPAEVFWPGEEYHQQYLEKGGQSAAKGATANIRCYG